MTRGANDTDPLDLTLRALLERLLAAQRPDDGWVNVRDERWPWRQLVAAAERGEVSLSRVGHRLLMRREDLDRWLDAQRIQPRRRGAATADPPPPPRDEHISKLLERAGFRKR
jgi:hypothetical protein